MIFDVNMLDSDGLFRRKARYVAGGHTTETPAALTYASVVSQDSLRIALTFAAFNGLDILACDIQNAYILQKLQHPSPTHLSYHGIWYVLH